MSADRVPDSGGQGDQSVTAGLAGSDPNYCSPGTGYFLGTQQKNAGFPAIPGYEAAARRAFESHGLQMPWYAALGNHDVMVQGNAPIETDVLGFKLAQIAVGGW